MGHREEEEDERRAQGGIAGEDPEGSDGGTVAGVALHRDDAGELYHTETYTGASRRLDPDGLDSERVPAKGASASS